MTWKYYIFYVAVTFLCWILGTLLLYGNRNKKLSLAIIYAGTLSVVVFTILLWIGLQRPPFRTLGETRLWYGLFMAIIGLVLYHRWKFKWLLTYSNALASVFLLLDLLKPETYDQTLMPALQSTWFIPHVIVYMFAYAILSAATIISLKGLYLDRKGERFSKELQYADNLVYIGFSFLSFGLLFGALWAKQAWGHYWTWDPKETWAFISWLVYLLYIHYRFRHRAENKLPLYLLVFAMIVILICWLGIHYLPVAQNSVHTYSS